MRLLVYLFLIGVLLYFFSIWGRQQGLKSEKDPASRPRRLFKAKGSSGEVWTQVYETADPEEAKLLQARLQEEEVDCILYEQGKKDIHGNSLKGVGVAVPKPAASHAQRIISRMPA
ncbi:MAG: DUF2007 domain-containing protein [Candidatus Omnitrophica bacterium]|nr:DUF2007 domain-containing protein [Candidatus Omnitrophota bacterium]